MLLEPTPNRILLPAKIGLRLEDRTHGWVAGHWILSSNTLPTQKLYTVSVRSRETRETLWIRPFVNHWEAVALWCQLCPNYDLFRKTGLNSFWSPGVFYDGELSYEFATIVPFLATTTDNTKPWTSNGTLTPNDATATDYLVVAGGGGGGANTSGGGAGAGGFRTATGFAVTPGASTTITVGLGGPGGGTTTSGTIGNNSVFSTITSTGGGFGGGGGAGTGGGNGGSGGGGNSGGAAGTGTGGQGNNGGTNGGGGGGASAVGTNNNGNGGNGTASSISGTSVIYAGGGASNAGNPGTGGGGGQSANGTANTGGGGGGWNGVGVAGDGGSGIIILSFTSNVSWDFAQPDTGEVRTIVYRHRGTTGY